MIGSHIWTCVGFEMLNVIAAASPTASISTERGATRALIGPTPVPLRWRADGTAPTTTVGHLLPEGVTTTLGTTAEVQGDLSKLSIISETGGALSVAISYWKIS